MNQKNSFLILTISFLLLSENTYAGLILNNFEVDAFTNPVIYDYGALNDGSLVVTNGVSDSFSQIINTSIPEEFNQTAHGVAINDSGTIGLNSRAMIQSSNNQSNGRTTINGLVEVGMADGFSNVFNQLGSQARSEARLAYSFALDTEHDFSLNINWFESFGFNTYNPWSFDVFLTGVCTPVSLDNSFNISPFCQASDGSIIDILNEPVTGTLTPGNYTFYIEGQYDLNDTAGFTTNDLPSMSAFLTLDDKAYDGGGNPAPEPTSLLLLLSGLGFLRYSNKKQ